VCHSHFDLYCNAHENSSYKAIGTTVKNFLVRVNWTPKSICSQVVNWRARPWSWVSQGAPFSKCNITKLNWKTNILSYKTVPKDYIYFSIIFIDCTELWIRFVSVQAVGIVRNGMHRRNRWSDVTATKYVSHIPLLPAKQLQKKTIYYCLCFKDHSWDTKMSL